MTGGNMLVGHDDDDDGDDYDDNRMFVFDQVELIDTIMSIPSCLQVQLFSLEDVFPPFLDTQVSLAPSHVCLSDGK